jgi:hypothetical protein
MKKAEAFAGLLAFPKKGFRGASGDRGTKNMPRLTKRTVDALTVAGKDYFVWDDEMPAEAPLLAHEHRLDRRGHVVVNAATFTVMPDKPYPIIAVSGPAGAAKSSFAEFVRTMIDPNEVSLIGMPRREDLPAFAKNNAILCFDNLSTISAYLSDDLCRLATGGGVGGRKDMVAMGLRRLGDVQMGKARLAADGGFCAVGICCCAGCRVECGGFQRAYGANRKEAFEAAIENDPIAQPILSMLEARPEKSWRGTTEQLWTRLKGEMQEASHAVDFPQSPVALGKALRRIEPALAARGVTMQRERVIAGTKDHPACQQVMQDCAGPVGSDADRREGSAMPQAQLFRGSQRLWQIWQIAAPL